MGEASDERPPQPVDRRLGVHSISSLSIRRASVHLVTEVKLDKEVMSADVKGGATLLGGSEPRNRGRKGGNCVVVPARL